jgi:hypothetical protein
MLQLPLLLMLQLPLLLMLQLPLLLHNGFMSVLLPGLWALKQTGDLTHHANHDLR